MVKTDELNLLSVDFNAKSAINNLESVILPNHTQSLDNISKAALLLPFAIQKELKLFDRSNSSSESNSGNLDKNEISAERRLNTIRNIEFKLNLKKKFSDKKKRLKSVFNTLTDKFSVEYNKCCFNIEEKEKNSFYNYLTREEVSTSNYLFYIYFLLVFR